MLQCRHEGLVAGVSNCGATLILLDPVPRWPITAADVAGP